MSKNFIDNKEFEDKISAYQKLLTNGEKDDQLNESLAKDLYLIATRLLGICSNMVEFGDQEEAMQEMITVVWGKLHKFKPGGGKGKCFNYCTTIMLNALRYTYSGNKRRWGMMRNLFQERFKDGFKSDG